MTVTLLGSGGEPVLGRCTHRLLRMVAHHAHLAAVVGQEDQVSRDGATGLVVLGIAAALLGAAVVIHGIIGIFSDMAQGLY